MSDTKPQTLARRMLSIQDAIRGIETDPSAYGQGYKIDRAVAALRGAAVDHGVWWYVAEVEYEQQVDSVGDGKLQTTATARLRVRFVNADDPEQHVDAWGVGQGVDRGDKAPGKAQSYALKQVLLTSFNLRGHEESEDDKSERAAPAANLAPIRDLLDAIAASGSPESLEELKPVLAAAKGDLSRDQVRALASAYHARLAEVEPPPPNEEPEVKEDDSPFDEHGELTA